MRIQLPSRPTMITAAVVVATFAAAGCSTTASRTPDSVADPASASSSAAAIPAPAPSISPATTGSYITWDEYQRKPSEYAGTHVVLFFNAPWCPTCQATVKSLDAARTDFPAGLTVVTVDYDTSTELKKQYGVTTQHTFVEVSPNGDQIKKWSGTESVEAINEKL